MKYLNNPYNEENNKSIFERIVLLAIVLVAIQLVLTLFDVNVTLGYFILPIIYVMIKYDRTKVNVLKIFIPHFFITSVVILLGVSQFKFTYETSNLLFLVGYIVAIYQNRNSQLSKDLNYEVFNFIGVYSFYIIAGSIVCMFYLVLNLLGKSYAVKSNFIFGGLDFFAIVFSTVTLSVSRSKVIQTSKVSSEKIFYKQEKTEIKNKKEAVVSSSDINSIIEYFEKSESYLGTNFSLDQMAKDLKINKQQVSEIINQDMNSSFYQLVAMYRIDHAKRLIGKNSNLTIEAIVDECGFSSKSTFNKYFKIFVGQTPSVYRSALV